MTIHNLHHAVVFLSITNFIQPEYRKGRYQVLEVDNEDNSLEDEAVEDTFQDVPPWISALYKEMKSVRKVAQIKIIRDELIQVPKIYIE